MVTEQIPRKQPTLGFHWVLADRLMMGLKVQHAPGHTWVLWAWGWGLPHCLHRLSKQGRQHITSEAVWDPSVYQEKKKSTQKMGILNMLRHGCFANLISPFSFHTQILTKSTQLFQMFWFLSAEPIPTEYGPVKTSPRRFRVESGLCCTAVKVRQEEGTCCKSATSWQLSGCKSFYSKAPGVTLVFKWPCENLLAFNSEKSMIYHRGIHRFAQEWETMHVCFIWFITAKKYTFSEAGKYI